MTRYLAIASDSETGVVIAGQVKDLTVCDLVTLNAAGFGELQNAFHIAEAKRMLS